MIKKKFNNSDAICSTLFGTGFLLGHCIHNPITFDCFVIGAIVIGGFFIATRLTDRLTKGF